MNIAIVGAGLIGHKRANSLDLNSDNLIHGEWVVALGNPYNLF